MNKDDVTLKLSRMSNFCNCGKKVHGAADCWVKGQGKGRGEGMEGGTAFNSKGVGKGCRQGRVEKEDILRASPSAAGHPAVADEAEHPRSLPESKNI